MWRAAPPPATEEACSALLSIDSGDYILNDFRFVGCLCQSDYPLAIPMCFIDWFLFRLNFRQHNAITSMSSQQKQRWCTSLWFDFYLSLVRLINRVFMVVLPLLTFWTQDVSIADTSCEVILFCPFLSLIRCGIRGMKKKKRYAAQLPF